MNPMIPDAFQLELSALLKKYNKEIRVSIQPMIVDAPPPKDELPISHPLEKQEIRKLKKK